MAYNGDKITGNEINWALLSRMLVMILLICGYFYYIWFELGDDPKEFSGYSFEGSPVAEVDQRGNVTDGLEQIQFENMVTSYGFGVRSGGVGGVDLPTRIIRPTKVLPFPDEPVTQRYNVVLYSYWPPASDNFCLDYDHANEDCLSTMTSGLPWQEYNNGALACPEHWLGDTVTIEGANLNGFAPCLDTGTTATCDNGTCTLFLLDSSLRYRGEKVTAYH